jgi:5-methylcytosine-specific restriction endonuclease McrA
LRRQDVFARDDYRCVYCGEVFEPGELTVDHVQPRLRGGDGSLGNVVTACSACNTRKGHRRIAEFLRDEPASRDNFFRLAAHVHRRHLRDIAEELRRGGLGKLRE